MLPLHCGCQQKPTLTLKSLFFKFPSQKASAHLFIVNMTFTLYTNVSKHFLSSGIWLVREISLRI
jgi:hypothetical protein